MITTSLLADGASWYLWNFDNPLNGFRTVAIWLTVILLAAFIIGTIASKDKRITFFKISAITAAIYAVVLAVTFTVLKFIDDGKTLNLNVFLPIIIGIVLIVACSITAAFSPKKAVKVAASIAAIVAAIAVLVSLGAYYSSGESLENNGLTEEQVNTIGLYVCAVLYLAAVIILAFALDKGKKGFDTKSISYAAICIAMSFALSYLRIVKMPQGGSITIASLLPLMLYSYMFGTKKGVFAGAIYGLLQAVQDPYILHPAQFILDYPAAFSAIGLSGMFSCSKKIKIPALRYALGSVIAGLARFISHFLSGIFAFGAFAGGDNVVMYSFTYQAAYVLPDIAIAIIVGVFVLLSRSLVSQIDKVKLVECPSSQN